MLRVSVKIRLFPSFLAFRLVLKRRVQAIMRTSLMKELNLSSSNSGTLVVTLRDGLSSSVLAGGETSGWLGNCGGSVSNQPDLSTKESVERDLLAAIPEMHNRQDCYL